MLTKSIIALLAISGSALATTYTCPNLDQFYGAKGAVETSFKQQVTSFQENAIDLHSGKYVFVTKNGEYMNIDREGRASLDLEFSSVHIEKVPFNSNNKKEVFGLALAGAASANFAGHEISAQAASSLVASYSHEKYKLTTTYHAGYNALGDHTETQGELTGVVTRKGLDGKYGSKTNGGNEIGGIRTSHGYQDTKAVIHADKHGFKTGAKGKIGGYIGPVHGDARGEAGIQANEHGINGYAKGPATVGIDHVGKVTTGGSANGAVTDHGINGQIKPVVNVTPAHHKRHFRQTSLDSTCLQYFQVVACGSAEVSREVKVQRKRVFEDALTQGHFERSEVTELKGAFCIVSDASTATRPSAITYSRSESGELALHDFSLTAEYQQFYVYKISK